MAASVGAMIRREIPPGRVADYARRAERDFDELWVVEDLSYAGGISQAATVLSATSVMVGHGIAPAPFRNPVALAMEWATLASMYPGRLACGIGHGVTAWMAQIGEAVPSPLALLGETITAVRSLLAGEVVTVAGRYVALDSVSLRFPPTQPPPVSAGVVGPKSLYLSGQVADGTILSEGHGPAEVERARQLIDAGGRQAGRSDPHRLTVFAAFYIGDPAGMAPPNPDALSGWEAVGSAPSRVARSLQSLIDAGADSVVLVPLGLGHEAQLRIAASAIVPRLAR
jgi:alkanesulfonate monooxygenase SsuD/methylene tetrahydromethanopterin reductase-like flavin-dependent oxidoreductase (luciferase family)